MLTRRGIIARNLGFAAWILAAFLFGLLTAHWVWLSH